MEYGETDLKSFLSQHQDKGSSIDMNSVRLLWQQMLESVNTIHQASIIHSDLKPANFLFVRGCLKLIDFGIARSMGPESTSVLRDSQVGTLNYISPEALLDEGNGIRVSLLGCVERRFAAPATCGRWGAFSTRWCMACRPSRTYRLRRSWWRSPTRSSPSPFPNWSRCGREVRRSNPWLMDVLKSCLQRNPAKRPPISGAGGLLQHPFLQPQGERAMRLFQAAALGNENMQDVVREVLETAEDPVWTLEDSVKRVCYVGV